MKLLLENQNKLAWLAGNWLQQDKDSMKVYSGGLSCNLPTAAVRAAFPVVEDILSNQPDKQSSLVLPPDLVFGYEELGSLEAFLTSGKMPPLPLEQMKKMKSFLEETCGSRIQVAISKSKNNNNVESPILEPNKITEEENAFPKIQTFPRDSTDEVLPFQVDPTTQKENASVSIGNNSAAAGTAGKSHVVVTGSWWCVDCHDSFVDEQALIDHKVKCEELTFDGDEEEEGEGSRKKNTECETIEVKQIISRAEREGGEKFEVLRKGGNVTWESRSDLKGADDVIKDFYRREQQEFFESLERCLEPGCHKLGFSTKEGLKMHRKSVHERAAAGTPSLNRNRFKCSWCDRSFSNKNLLGLHREREHLGLVYSCGVCKLMFVHNFNARNHASKSGHSMDLFEKVKDIYWED